MGTNEVLKERNEVPLLEVTRIKVLCKSLFLLKGNLFPLLQSRKETFNCKTFSYDLHEASQELDQL